MNISIRNAQIHDAHLIAEAERAIAQQPGYFCSAPSELSDQNVVQTITKTLQTQKGVYLVAEHEGTVVGHGFLEPLRLKSLEHVAELNLVVHPGWEGKGIGTLLIQRLIEWARQSKWIEKIELNVRASNEKALCLYTKMGFREEGRLRKRVKVTERYIDDLVMALHIKGTHPSEKIEICRTGVYGVAIQHDKILLITQEHGPHKGKFDLPGGRIEFGETIEETLRREIQEEVSMGFDAMQLIDNISERVDVPSQNGNPPYSSHRIGLIYLISGLHPLNTKSTELLNYAWQDLHAIHEQECSQFAWTQVSILKRSKETSK